MAGHHGKKWPRSEISRQSVEQNNSKTCSHNCWVNSDPDNVFSNFFFHKVEIGQTSKPDDEHKAQADVIASKGKCENGTDKVADF